MKNNICFTKHDSIQSQEQRHLLPLLSWIPAPLLIKRIILLSICFFLKKIIKSLLWSWNASLLSWDWSLRSTGFNSLQPCAYVCAEERDWTGHLLHLDRDLWADLAWRLRFQDQSKPTQKLTFSLPPSAFLALLYHSVITVPKMEHAAGKWSLLSLNHSCLLIDNLNCLWISGLHLLMTSLYLVGFVPAVVLGNLGRSSPSLLFSFPEPSSSAKKSNRFHWSFRTWLNNATAGTCSVGPSGRRMD